MDWNSDDEKACSVIYNIDITYDVPYENSKRLLQISVSFDKKKIPVEN
jgi:hypothetical protein